MTRFCTTDRHPYETHLCFVHLHLFFYFFLFFPCKLSRSTTFFFFFLKKRTSQLLFPPAVVAVSLAFWLSALLAWPVAFFVLFRIYICELWDLVLTSTKKRKQTKNCLEAMAPFANFLGELCRFKGTLVFFKNLTVLSMCISKCLVYFFSLVLKANVFCHYYYIMTIWACTFFPKPFYDKGTSPIFCNTAATMLVNQHGLSYNPLTTRWYQEGACFSCLFV